ncbi:hypothetical protein JYK22_14060, partial [Nonomuraea sp. RK-328]|nr:hypothetical protein [Nonomuraea sp. RK-328]
VTRRVRIAGAVLSLAVTAVGVLWWAVPASYPFGAGDRVTVSLSHLFEHDVGGAMTLVAGLAGLATAFASGWVLRAGAIAQVVFFGVVMSDAGIMSLFGYGLAVLGPVALVGVLVMGCVRRRPWAWAGLATLAGGVAASALAGFPLWLAAGKIAGSLYDYAGRVSWTLADCMACLVWVVVAAKAYRSGGPPAWARPAAVLRWGRVATIGAALCPLPYALYRLTWLTPWPTDSGLTGSHLDPALRTQGLAIAFGALGGAVLTLGLISRWGEVFPRWVPVVHGRPVPVRLPVTAGGIVAGACCVASPGLVVNAVERDQLFTVLMWPYPLWGVLLGAGVLAYWLRRRPYAPSAAVS